MRTKNLFKTLLLCLPLMVACSSNDDSENNEQKSSNLPSTEIYVQGQILGLNTAETRASYGWPLVTEDGYETARFFIRSDGKIPGYIDQSSVLYYGRISGGNNVGKVYTLCNYGQYNDRDYDYTKVDKKTGQNIGLFRYIYDEYGQTTQVALKEVPAITDLLNDDRAVYEAAGNTARVAEIDALLAKGEEYLSKHMLWYVVKEVGGKGYWHVDGIISENEVPKYTVSSSSVPNNVEVDIHQQEHKDWNEIKTSVLIRADVENIEINIPISEDNIVEQDDFAIRVYDFYYKEYAVTHTVTHDAKGITIKISDIPASLIAELRENIGDGLTVEIHSYCKEDDNVWAEMKNSTVKTGKSVTFSGQVTSAYNDEVVPLYIKK